MLVTPFLEDGALDEEGLIRLVEHVVGSKVHGIAVGGLASEAHALSDQERRRIMEIITSQVRGRVPVLVAVTAESTPLAIALARHAEQSDATAIMLAPPFITRAGIGDLQRHYGAVAEAVRLPIVIQDAPGYIGRELGVELMACLVREYSNICSVKTEALPAGSIIAELRAKLGQSVSIFSGTGGLYFLDALRAGAAGTVPGCDVPRFLVGVYQAYAAGRLAEAEDRFRKILPLLVYQMQSLDICIASEKCILAHKGIIARPHLRSPAPGLGRHAIDVLIALYEELNASL